MTRAPRRSTVYDPTVYPVEEKVGEDFLQTLIVELLRPLIARWLAFRRVHAFTGADQFIYYAQFDPLKRWAPDVYVVPGVDPAAVPSSWKTWEADPPSFALEVVSKDWEKDYVDAPTACDKAGVKELVVFDPHYERSDERFCFQVFRRVGKRGFVRVAVTNEDRIRSKTLGCWIRVVGTDRDVRLRLGTGATGDALFPTAEEAESSAKEQERAAKEQERAAKEEALAAKEEAIARIAELERRLAETARSRAPGRGKRRKR